MTRLIRSANTWWQGKTEAERFVLYYICLRHNYGMPAIEAFVTAKKNWPVFGEQGDLIATVRRAIHQGVSA